MRSLSERQRRAIERGCDELMTLCEYHFAKRPRMLGNLRKDYVHLAVRLFTALDSDWERRYQSRNRK
jgi:hypothetical protein